MPAPPPYEQWADADPRRRGEIEVALGSELLVADRLTGLGWRYLQYPIGRICRRANVTPHAATVILRLFQSVWMHHVATVRSVRAGLHHASLAQVRSGFEARAILRFVLLPRVTLRQRYKEGGRERVRRVTLPKGRRLDREMRARIYQAFVYIEVERVMAEHRARPGFKRRARVLNIEGAKARVSEMESLVGAEWIRRMRSKRLAGLSLRDLIYSVGQGEDYDFAYSWLSWSTHSTALMDQFHLLESGAPVLLDLSLDFEALRASILVTSKGLNEALGVLSEQACGGSAAELEDIKRRLDDLTVATRPPTSRKMGRRRPPGRS